VIPARANKEQVLHISICRFYREEEPAPVIVYHSDVMWPYYNILFVYFTFRSVCYKWCLLNKEEEADEEEEEEEEVAFVSVTIC
jgi:hypothetical protein